jgi:hypothetical protein
VYQLGVLITSWSAKESPSRLHHPLTGCPGSGAVTAQARSATRLAGWFGHRIWTPSYPPPRVPSSDFLAPRHRVPSKSQAPDTSIAMNASPAKRPLTPRLAVPPLPKGEGKKSESQPSPRGEGARRRRAGEGSLSTPLDFDGALPRGILGFIISRLLWYYCLGSLFKVVADELGCPSRYNPVAPSAITVKCDVRPRAGRGVNPRNGNKG